MYVCVNEKISMTREKTLRSFILHLNLLTVILLTCQGRPFSWKHHLCFTRVSFYVTPSFSLSRTLWVIVYFIQRRHQWNFIESLFPCRALDCQSIKMSDLTVPESQCWILYRPCDCTSPCDIEWNIEAAAVGCCTAEAESKQEIIEWVESDGDGETLHPAQEKLKDDGVFTGDFLDEAWVQHCLAAIIQGSQYRYQAMNAIRQMSAAVQHRSCNEMDIRLG